MKIDHRDVQPGDRFTASGTVIKSDYSETSQLVVRFDGGVCSKYLTHNDLAQAVITRPERPLEVKDRVTWPGNDGLGPWRVIAIYNDKAWIERDGVFETARLANLIRVVETEQ